jgi:hypothetical protein
MARTRMVNECANYCMVSAPVCHFFSPVSKYLHFSGSPTDGSPRQSSLSSGIVQPLDVAGQCWHVRHLLTHSGESSMIIFLPSLLL